MSGLTILQPVPQDKPEGVDIHPTCAKCTGLCCRYITQEIKRPRNKSDLDDLRWQMIHQGINVLIMSRRWYLQIEAVCQHLLPDNLCAIYEDRPQACRDYMPDPCDFTVADGVEVEDYITFRTYEEAEAYVKRGELPEQNAAASGRAA